MRTIKALTTVIFFNKNRHLFCQKADILKTYLQIIPPHTIYQLKQLKEKTLQDALSNLQQSQQNNQIFQPKQQDIRVVLKQVKKRTSMIAVPTLTRIAQLACRQQNSQHNIQLRKAYTKIIRNTKNKTQKIPLQHLIDMMYKLVKLGKKQYDLMKQIQKVIIQQKVRVDFPLVRKILYSYTHLNQGSAVLYKHISKTLIVGQHQFRPLELAQAAYMLSKVSDNAQGGYGVFNVAEKHIQSSLPRMDFGELVKASSYMLTQNIGSNTFQGLLQQHLYNKYPSKDRLRINDYVSLLKSTSGYFFKYKQGALLSMLKASTIRMAQFASLQQFQDIVWSWGRIGKGDKETWKCLQHQINRRISQLKPRQVAFVYHSLCSSQHSSNQIIQTLQQKFLKLDLPTINQHYLIKFLLGMQRRKLFDTSKFSQVSLVISQRIQTLSNPQFLSFLKILNESDIDFQSKEPIQPVIQSLMPMANQLQKRLYLLKLTQISELVYLFVKLGLQNNQLVEKCFSALDNVINIPKSAFIKAFFSFTMKQRYQKGLQFVPILQQLIKYGPIGYFFSPHQFPLLAYCLFHYSVRGTNIKINKQLLKQTQEAIRQINPVILNQFVLKAYNQTLKLIDQQNRQQQK